MPMFISTFYSYKGGVGRTSALVNVAVELAKSGRSVLLVDFDLEAPGLDTFDLLSNTRNVGGIVQFVTDYVDNKTPPNVGEYVYEAPMSADEKLGLKGKIWVMPAGRRDSGYDRLLSQIHWQSLYSEMEGFLLFEDLKKQWDKTYSPDYVLIDSRTGHTDVGGICTRQLADLVVLLFTPNDQNLMGLPPIVKAIRKESERSVDRTIHTCFVASNVPTLDDEEGILRRLMGKFSRALAEGKSKERIFTVQRYESLQLLNQDIFTLVRPRSRLARQYGEITKFIIEQNLKDRQGVLDFLKHSVRNERMLHVSREYSDKRISSILAMYSDDAEILLWVARCYTYRSSPNEAISLLKKAESATRNETALIRAGIHLDLAERHLTSQQVAIAGNHLSKVAALSGLGAAEVRRLLDLWYVSGQRPGKELLDCFERANLAVDEYSYVLADFYERGGWQKFVSDLLLNCDTEKLSGNADRLHYLLFSLLGSHQFEHLPEIASSLIKIRGESVPNQFNAAMADWAFSGAPSPDRFRRLLQEVDGNDEEADANFFQCISVAFSVVGKPTEAIHSLSRAFERNQRVPISKLSCWRYQVVPQDEFEEDLLEIQSFIQTGSPAPRFLRES